MDILVPAINAVAKVWHVLVIGNSLHVESAFRFIKYS